MDEVVAHGVGRSFAEDRAAGVAGDDPSEREHDEDDPEQDRDRDEKPAKDELDHRWSAPLRSFMWWELDGGAARAAPPFDSFAKRTGQEAGGLRKPPHRPGKYSNAPVRPLCSGCWVSHWTA